jgi:two-component system NtrC family sensor kinase
VQITLKTKLITAFLAIIVICGLVATLVATRLIGTGVIAQAQEKVRNDLNAARLIYHQETQKVADIVRFTALRFFIKDAMAERDLQTLQTQLEQIRAAESLDILTLTDSNGLVLLRSLNPATSSDDQSNDDFVQYVLTQKTIVSGTAIIPPEELAKESPELAQQARIQIVPTAKAKSTTQTEQDSGMIIKAAAPVLAYDGTLIGVLYGGKLLNRNYEIVDRVKQTVYEQVSYEGKDIGTATIFQGDLRISTNVKQADGSRAIGTRVSAEVYDQVLAKGIPWTDRAYVVNNWYIAAYEPIKNIKGRIIGILYVGVLEEKFTDIRDRAVAIFLGIMAAGMFAALIVAGFLENQILGPLKRLVHASGEWAKGNLEYQVKTTGGDEIAQLGETFNLMASSLKERDRRLKEYASQQLIKSERLATLGQLAAGVAHEINNPLGAILMYTNLALEDVPKDSRLVRNNLQKASREALRCKDIVSGLLDFARQREPKAELTDVNEILQRTLALLEKQTLFQNVQIVKTPAGSLPRILADVGQMQQVFTNIMLNAAEAMEGKGRLTIVTRLAPDNEYVEIEFADTGCGISPENIDKIFDPFFTTKRVGHGTGLGLAVSHGIVASHKGTIEVKSNPGKGATFTVRLPVNKEEQK